MSIRRRVFSKSDTKKTVDGRTVKLLDFSQNLFLCVLVLWHFKHFCDLTAWIHAELLMKNSLRLVRASSHVSFVASRKYV